MPEVPTTLTVDEHGSSRVAGPGAGQTLGFVSER